MTNQILIREPETLFSIIYDPSIKGEDRNSYEWCKTRILRAQEDGTLDEEIAEEIIGRLNHEKGIYITQNPSRKLTGGNGDFTQDLFD